MHENLNIMRHIASDSEQRNETLATLALQSQRDSKHLKALTQVATMYLPATLIAVSLRLSSAFLGNLLTPGTTA
jgi:hypothetical protein